MTANNKIALGTMLWVLLSIVAYASVAFIGLSFMPTDWNWAVRIAFVLAEVVILPLLAMMFTDEISKAVIADTVDPDDFQKGVEATKKAVIAAKVDCDYSGGRSIVQQMVIVP